MSHMHTPGALLPGQMPGAWYDLACRVRTVQAISSCALEALPGGLGEAANERINHSASLIAGMQDVLALMEQDVDTIEKELKL